MKRDVADLQIESRPGPQPGSQPAAQNAHRDNPSVSPETLADLFSVEDRAARRSVVERIVADEGHEPGRHLDALRRILANPNPLVRWTGAYVMARIDVYDAHAASVFCEALSSSDPDRRWASARMLARLGLKQPASVRRELVTAARCDHPVARRMALYALREMGADGEEIVSLVEDAVRASSTLERLAALSLLASLEDCSDRAASIALSLVQSDPEVRVRRAAAVALGKVGNRGKTIIDTLSRAAANDFDKSLARAAEHSLRRLSD